MQRPEAKKKESKNNSAIKMRGQRLCWPIRSSINTATTSAAGGSSSASLPFARQNPNGDDDDDDGLIASRQNTVERAFGGNAVFIAFASRWLINPIR